MKLLRAALQPNVVRNALAVSAVVGVVLNLVNHGGKLLDGQPLPWVHVLMNFVVPYCVASFSAARIEVARSNERCRGEGSELG